jgi:hypothetical protein
MVGFFKICPKIIGLFSIESKWKIFNIKINRNLLSESSLKFLVVNKIFLLCLDGISWEYFRVFSTTILQAKPWENIWNCRRKYMFMFLIKLISCLGNNNMSLNQNVCRDHTTGCFVAFWVDISLLKSRWNKNKLFSPALELIHWRGTRIFTDFRRQSQYLDNHWKFWP